MKPFNSSACNSGKLAIIITNMDMSKKGLNAGLALTILGVASYFAGGMVSTTAFIPAYFGIPILLSSLLAKKPGKLMLGMHIAVTFGLLGFLATMGRLVRKFVVGEFEMNLANVATIAMSLICLVFVIQCVKSFIAARRNK